MKISKWQRQYWAPYGKVIDYNDEMFVSPENKEKTHGMSIVKIEKFFNKNKKIKHYCIHGKYAEVYFSKTLKLALSIANDLIQYTTLPKNKYKWVNCFLVKI